MNKKNVLILHADQLRYDALGCNGNSFARTSNIDSLASDGINFTRHLSSNPVCSPSRASLLTGLTVLGHGLVSNGMALWNIEDIGFNDEVKNFSKSTETIMPLVKIPTLADMLSEKGYYTALFGKLHLQPHLAKKEYGFIEAHDYLEEDFDPNWEGPFYGFKHVRLIDGHGENPCTKREGAHYYYWLKKNHPDVLEQIHSKNYIKNTIDDLYDCYLSQIPSEIHNTMWLADEFCNHIENRGAKNDEPFFAFVGFPDPHHPFTPPEDIAKEFNNIKLPETAIRDERIYQKPTLARKALESCHLSSKTATEQAIRNTYASIALIDKAVGKIIDYLKSKDLYDDTIILFTSDHGDFLGDYDCLRKSTSVFNCLVHVPFILKPVNSFENMINHTPMCNYDTVPTILNMLGIETPKHVQGKDIFSSNTNRNMPFILSYWQGDARGQNITLYDERYRYTYYPQTDEEEIYDHKIDPMELNNLLFSPDENIIRISKVFKTKLLEMYLKYDTREFGRYGHW